MSVSAVQKDQVVISPLVNLATTNLASYQSTLGNLARVLKNVNCTVLSKSISDLFINPKNQEILNDPKINTLASKLVQGFLHLQREYLTEALTYLSLHTSKLKLQGEETIPAISDTSLKSAIRVLGVPRFEDRFKKRIIINLVEALSDPAIRKEIKLSGESDSKNQENLRTYLLVEATLKFRDEVIDLVTRQDLKQFNSKNSIN